MAETQKTDFRRALGTFATGVTIVTTTGADGTPVGVTASSFNSVSLDPPLVLWSLARNSLSHDAFCSSGHFAIHVLAASQEALSNRFARSREDKFHDTAWRPGTLGSPILEDYAALFECRTSHLYEGGDHVILVGEVIGFDTHDVPPLLFHGGSYAERRARPQGTAGETVDLETGRFTDDFLFYLIARTYFQTTYPSRALLRDLGLTQRDHLMLVALSMTAPASADEMRAWLNHTGQAPDAAALEDMKQRGLLEEKDGRFTMAPSGREKFLAVLSATKAFEADIADHFTPGELAEMKTLLRRVIALTANPPIFEAPAAPGEDA